MILEYQVRSVGHEKLRAVIRSIDQEADRSARRGEAREARAQRARDTTANKAQAAANAEARAEARAQAKTERDRITSIRKKEREEARARATREREEKRTADKVRAYEQRQYAGVLSHRNAMADKARRTEELLAKRSLVTRQQTAARIRGGAGRVFSGTARSIGTGVSTLGSVGVLGGTMLAGNAVTTHASEKAMATQLANQASDKADPGLRDQLLNEAQQVRGFTGAEVMEGMGEFVAKTGDLTAARGIIRDLGDLSLATGADLSDLGATAGAAFNVIRDQIQDPKQQLIELEELMRALAQQGSMGAVEIRDLARDFGKLGAATRSFEGGAPELLRTMGAFAQMAVARGGAEGSADASTASARLASDIVTNKKKFKTLGVDIKSEKDPTKLRDPLAIMKDVLTKTKGDVEKTSGLLGIESKKIFNSLAAVYSEAEKRKKGSGISAVDEEFARFAGAELTKDKMRGKADLRAADEDVQFTNMMKAFNTELGSRLLPELTKLIPVLAQLTPVVGDLAEKGIKFTQWLSENPYEGLAVVVGAFMVKELAAVGFAALFEAAIAKALPGPGLDVGGDVGGGGKGSKARRGGRAGRGGRLMAGGRLATLARGAGAVGLVGAAAAGLSYGAAHLYTESDYGKAQIAKEAAREQKFYGVGYYEGDQDKASREFYANHVGMGAGFDPGAVQGVQRSLGVSPQTGKGAQQQQPIDLAKFERIMQMSEKAAQMNLEAARVQQQNATVAKNDVARTTPVLFRGTGG